MANRLVVSIVGDNRDLQKTLKDTQKRLEGQTAGMQKVAQGMSRAGAQMTKYITLPLVGLGAASVKAGMDFEDAMTKSLAIMSDVTPEIRKQMEDTARDVVNYTTFSATEAAEAYFYLASAGLDAAQSIEALPRVAQFAQAGNFDLARATDLLTDAQSALGLTIRDDVVANMENMTRVSDVLVRANTLANATVQQFSESLTTRAGAALRLVNKDIEEGVAVLAAWADQGVKGAEAGTRLDIVLRDLQNAALKNRDMFDDMGIAVFDTDGNMRNLADIIGDMEVAFDGMSDAQLRSTLTTLGFTDRSIAATASLLGSSEAIKEYEDQLRSATGYTAQVAGKQMESMTAQLRQLRNRAIDAGISIYEVLSPSIENLIEKMGDAVDWFRDLSEENKRLAINLGIAVAAIGPALLVFGKLLTLSIAIKTNLALMSAAVGATKVTLAGLAGALAVKLGIFALAAAAIYDFQDGIRGLAKEINLVTEGQKTWQEALAAGYTEYGIHAPAVRWLTDKILELTGVTEKATDYHEGFTHAMENANIVAGNTERTLEQLNQELMDGTITVDEYTEAVNANVTAQQNQYSALFANFLLAADMRERTEALTEAMEKARKAEEEYGAEAEETTKAREEAIRVMDREYTEVLPALIKKKGDLTLEEYAHMKALHEGAEQAIAWGVITREEYNQTLIQGDIVRHGIEHNMQAVAHVMNEAAKAADGVTEAVNNIPTERTITIDVNDSYARGRLHAFEQYASRATRDRTLNITTNYSVGRHHAYEQFADGGIVGASGGLMLPQMDSGGVLAMLHPPEVVLNADQALRLVWNMANQKAEGGRGSVSNTFNIDQMVVREEADIYKVASELYSMQKTELAGSGIR